MRYIYTQRDYRTVAHCRSFNIFLLVAKSDKLIESLVLIAASAPMGILLRLLIDGFTF